MQSCDAQDNHAFLLGHFAERLFAEAPASVLDVGCGAGRLLVACAERGVPALGIEGSRERVEALLAAGHEARHGSAVELPFEEDAFDWVTMRHVPHHLEDPRAALSEATRVARSGVLVAEPWFDAGLPSQRVALAYDEWLKAQHRRDGMFHASCLSAAELAGLLPADARGNISIETVLRLRARALPEVEAEAAPYLAERGPDSTEAFEFAAIIAEAREVGISWNGSLLLGVRLV